MKNDSFELNYNEVDILTLELGIELIPMVDAEKGAELLERIKGVRQQVALDLGLKSQKFISLIM